MTVNDIFPNDDLARHRVAQLAMTAAYVEKYGIYTHDEMARFEKEAIPSWPQGKEEHRFVALLNNEIVGIGDLTRLPDEWRLVEPIHVLPWLWRCGIGRMLWDRCVAVAGSKGAPGVRVWSLIKNKGASDFYVRMGCVAVSPGTIRLHQHEEQVTGYELRF